MQPNLFYYGNVAHDNSVLMNICDSCKLNFNVNVCNAPTLISREKNLYKINIEGKKIWGGGAKNCILPHLLDGIYCKNDVVKWCM